MVVRCYCATSRIHHIISSLYNVKVRIISDTGKKTLRFIVSFSSVATRVYSFYIEYQFVPAKFIKSSSRPYDFRTQAALCHLLVIDDKTTALPVKQLDSVTGAIVENVDNTIRRVEIIAAYQLGQAKNTLTHVYWSATNPKNICFVEYKHKVFRAKVVKLEAHTKAAKVGCLRLTRLAFYSH